jgi:hypothetical protein
MTAAKTRVWLVRHAPTAWTGRRYCGRADPALSDEGVHVAGAVAAALADEVPPGTPIWASPARRARATADAIAAAVAGSVEVVDDLAEVDVGRGSPGAPTRSPILRRSGEGAVDWLDGSRRPTSSAPRRGGIRRPAGPACGSPRDALHAVSALMAGRRRRPGGAGGWRVLRLLCGGSPEPLLAARAALERRSLRPGPDRRDGGGARRLDA